MDAYMGPERRHASLPVEWLAAQFDDLKAETKDRHERLRADMNAGFQGLAQKLDAHAKDDQLVADRVLIIETERKEESRQQVRKGTLAGMVAAAGLTAGWELLKHRLWP